MNAEPVNVPTRGMLVAPNRDAGLPPHEDCWAIILARGDGARLRPLTQLLAAGERLIARTPESRLTLRLNEAGGGDWGDPIRAVATLWRPGRRPSRLDDLSLPAGA